MRAFLGVIFVGSVIGCDSPDGFPKIVTGRPIRVTVTTTLLADAVRQVGGSHVEVTSLMGPGVDPHQYKASAGDLHRLRRADLILYHGLHLEGKIADVLAKKPHARAVGEAIPAADLLPADDSTEGGHDPHVWFDPRLWARVVEAVAVALAETAPDRAAEFRSNAERYRAELDALHAEMLDRVSAVPADRRVLITAHDAFGYFGRAYGFEVHGLQGVSTAAEPGTRDVQDLARLIGSRRAAAIFGESSVPDRNLQAVRDAVKAGYGFDVAVLNGALYSDALGDPGGPAGTYVNMFRHNVCTIVNALRPTAR